MVSSLQERAARLVACEAVSAKRPPHAAVWSRQTPMPPDLEALTSAADGLELADGTRVLSLEEIEPATRWLVEDKSLGWADELFLIGERDGVIIVRDPDPERRRAGGGVLEAPTDGLETFKRVAMDLIGYLETRAGLGPDPRPTPEAAVQRAIAAKDAPALAKALAEPFYPGAEMTAAHAALVLGELLVHAGDDVGAMRAFVRSVSFRVQSARRGAEAEERAAGFRAAARVAEAAGAKALAESCLARAEV